MSFPPYVLKDENAVYEDVLCGHLTVIVRRLRQIPPEHFDFQPVSQAAPSPRMLAVHTWQWLICDRQHIETREPAKHPRIPDPPADQQALCDVLAREAENWRALLRAQTPETLNEMRSQFDDMPMNVRGFIAHMVQNTIYKSGQLATIYFALGLDGTEPYEAPLPNPIYEELFGPQETLKDLSD